MNKEINWEEVSFGIITSAGSAKSSAMEAIYAARDYNFELAAEKLKEANTEIGNASHMHFDVIQKEAQGEQLDFKVLFLHAEDQLLTTQTLILMATEFVELYKRLAK